MPSTGENRNAKTITEIVPKTHAIDQEKIAMQLQKQNNKNRKSPCPYLEKQEAERVS